MNLKQFAKRAIDLKNKGGVVGICHNEVRVVYYTYPYDEEKIVRQEITYATQRRASAQRLFYLILAARRPVSDFFEPISTCAHCGESHAVKGGLCAGCQPRQKCEDCDGKGTIHVAHPLSRWGQDVICAVCDGEGVLQYTR